MILQFLFLILTNSLSKNQEFHLDFNWAQTKSGLDILEQGQG